LSASERSASDHSLERESLRVDVSPAVALDGRFEIAADIVLPARDALRTPPTLLFCLPGGFLSRRYFDLGDPADPVERTYSFAAHMARAGFAVAAIDHLGTGDSSRPAREEDGYALGVEAIACANQAAWDLIRERIAQRWRRDADELVSIGVGHSMGSALTVAQQASHAPHAALVLQSFSTRGLPRFMQDEEAALAGDPARARAGIADLVRTRYRTPYPEMPGHDEEGRSAAFSVGTAPPLAERLLVEASTRLLAMAGSLTLIPGAYAPYAERIRVPVFVSMGDHDLLTAQEVSPMLPHAPEIVAHEVADCWHCHNVANTRAALWDRTLHWLDAVARPA
jgi:alpha-beta hydrolase superfamily lysophospholipase